MGVVAAGEKKNIDNTASLLSNTYRLSLPVTNTPSVRRRSGEWSLVTTVTEQTRSDKQYSSRLFSSYQLNAHFLYSITIYRGVQK